ncbi:hypothetical protein HRTV-10_gp46 [Halorubrum tailed virus 10]|uniref:Uncharacterized protein n=1 Tax=Halorubrum tailed virus 10 TaxID=2877991 RepID=A0AAE9BUS4_9CAUD|nr:hypothetical protein M1M36_gp086 [Halorubrum tailed virus 10]UBF19630.1 hypothetical protein HRTV-10_gp46 [Halorubrum tailed virus 10]UBF20002.1 hypothetical protein HRTV-22_gp47 [Halorubrum virus HRTV-22]UBF20128.1 hypothetical protein HRTV-26_gp47 [Halorubrum virus HRTV-26]UFK26317.1 hypothetical protein [Hardygib1 virus]
MTNGLIEVVTEPGDSDFEFPPLFQDQSYHYDVTDFYWTKSGDVAHYIRLKNDEDFNWPPTVDVGINIIEVNDDTYHSRRREGSSDN